MGGETGTATARHGVEGRGCAMAPDGEAGGDNAWSVAIVGAAMGNAALPFRLSPLTPERALDRDGESAAKPGFAFSRQGSDHRNRGAPSARLLRHAVSRYRGTLPGM